MSPNVFTEVQGMSQCSITQRYFRRMLAFRNCRILYYLSRQGLSSNVSAPCLRGFATTQEEAKVYDMPIKMENPFKQPEKRCTLCNVSVDFRNIQLLSQFISPYTGRIYGRHITGLCGHKQKQVTKAIKRARSMGYMSVTLKDPQFMKDPNVCNIRQLE